jgi:chaperone required for assembly of F1-ATPase
LASLQRQSWAPFLDNLSRHLKLPSFNVTSSLGPVQQDKTICEAFGQFISGLNNYQLAGNRPSMKICPQFYAPRLCLAYYWICVHCKSALLPWAFSLGVADGMQVTKLALLEQEHQASLWGRRREYHDLAEAELLKKVSLGGLFLLE